MASKIPATKNAEFVFRCCLFSRSTNQIQSNPTLSTGDVKTSLDGGAFANLTTLPDVDPDSTVQVKVTLSAAEMNGDEVMVVFQDAAGAEWHDQVFVIHTAGQTFDTMDTNIDSALADTNELQGDWANGGRLDLILDARASQTSVDDIPTNAELTAALGTLNDPTAAAIADAVLDEALAGHTTAGTLGKAVTDVLDDTGTSGVVVGSFVADSITAAAIAAAAANEIADAVLARGVGNVEDTADAHSLAAIVLAALESAISGTTWTIKKTDGSTTFTTKTVTVDANANPITAVT